MAYSFAEKELHDQMLRAWVDSLQRGGYTVTAIALPNYQQPSQIGEGSIPDLIAKTSTGGWIIGEVKTCGDIDNSHTKGQLEDYLRMQAEVKLLVPISCQGIANQAVENWGFQQVEVLTYSAA